MFGLSLGSLIRIGTAIVLASIIGIWIGIRAGWKPGSRFDKVSTGTTLRQLDALEQSPQPSQTSWLIITRRVGLGISPRLRRRRFSAVQVWS